MSNDKMNLPSITPGNDLEKTEETKRTEIRAQRDVQVERLEVAAKAVEVVESALDVWEAHERYKETKAEWEGRVQTAEKKVEEAQLSLQETKAKNDLEREKLRQLDAKCQPIIEMLTDTIEDIRQAPPELRSELREEAIRMGELLTQID